MRKPWIDRKVKTALRKKARMKKICKEFDIRRYQQWKADTQSLERQSNYSYINNIIEFNEINDNKPDKQKRFWCYIKSLWKDNIGISPGRLINTAMDKTNILNRQYQSAFTQEDTDHIPGHTGTPYPDMEEIQVEEEGLGSC